MQVAKHLGAVVTATVSGPGLDAVAALGANEVIDYSALAIVAISFGPMPILTAGILMTLLTAALVVDSSRADRLVAPLDGHRGD